MQAGAVVRTRHLDTAVVGGFVARTVLATWAAPAMRSPEKKPHVRRPVSLDRQSSPHAGPDVFEVRFFAPSEAKILDQKSKLIYIF
jgi:hypothetical protein